MNRLGYWNGQLEKTEIEYDVVEEKDVSSETSVEGDSSAKIFGAYNEPDKMDYIVAACCGILTGLFDAFWTGEFSLSKAQSWGRTKANSFVIKVAQLRGYSKNDLAGSIRFLEKDAPMASDNMTNVWGEDYNTIFVTLATMLP